MKFLLVVVLFTLSPDNNLENGKVLTKKYDTLEECNTEGRNFRRNIEIDPVVKSISFCLKPSDL